MSAELFTGGCMFRAGDMVLSSGEFWADDDAAWAGWLSSIDKMVRLNDPWALLVACPDGGTFLVDVHGGWRDRVRHLNGRNIRLVYPAERKTIDEVPA